jgi:DNA repair protein SbcC/Rad50
MKILKIRLKNINSLKGIQEVDFTSHPLSEAGLFAITGPTGSGKTTILDAITLGLYNQVPRTGKISKNFVDKAGVILTRNTLEAFAEITYQCSKGTYISKWSIAKNRNGNLNDYEMEIAPADSLVPLDVNRSHVPDKNSELIGLNYEQFIRAIILAQGDFAKFLQAKEDQRSKLLEQITGGDIYRRLGIKAYEMFKLHGQELEAMILQRDSHRKMLIEKEVFGEKMKRFEALEKELSTLQASNEQLQEAINLKNEIERSETRLRELNEHISDKKSELETFNTTKGIKLEKHLALVPVHESLQQWKNAKKEETAIVAEAERISGVISDLKKEIKKLRATIAGITKDPDSDPVAALDALREKIMALDTKIRSESTKIEQKQEMLQDLAARTGMKYDPEQLSAFEAAASERIETDGNEINFLKKELGTDTIEDPETRLRELRTTQEKVNVISMESVNLDTLHQNLEETRQERKTLSEEIAALPGQVTAQEMKVAAEKLQRDNDRLELQNRNLRASLEEHRKQLVPGQPCPLCGALEHPLLKEEEKEEDELATKLEKSEHDFQKETALLAELQSNLKNKKEHAAKLSSRESDFEKQIKRKEEEISILKNELPERFREMENGELKAEVGADITRLDRYIALTGRYKDLVKIPAILEELKKASGQHDGLSKERRALFEGDDVMRTTGDLVRKWNEKNTDLRNQSELLTGYSKKRETINEQVGGYDRSIIAVIGPMGYKKTEDALADLLPTEESEKLRSLKQQITDGINASENQKRVVSDRIVELKEKDREEKKEKLQEVLEENSDLIAEKKEERDDLVSKKRTQEAFTKKIDDLNRSIEQLERESLKWKLLRELIGDNEGKKFSTFAQRLTLYKLILLANKRLKSLNDRYLLDLPKEDEDESLSVIDTHMGDQRRSVKSLSGGETFLISLGLALALSDLAARNIRINSLFIDEGFGSLDKLTLDQTIDTLEKLQYETGKSIGVISHVEAMQERITTQIQVSKNGQGYSSVNIIV